MPKQPRLNGIKSFYSYTYEEAAEVSGVSPRTVRTWAKLGLRVMDNERPHLIRGDDLRSYIKSNRKRRRTKTQIDTFYCVCCRKERHAAENMADCDIRCNRARLTLLCAACGTVVTKPVALARVPEIARKLDLTIKRH